MKYFALFGNPVSHSISPRLHNIALQGLGQKGVYGRILLEHGSDIIAKFKKYNLTGANITIPFKESVLADCNELDSIAADIGSINTLVGKKGKIKGYNTDAPGFMMAIAEFGKIDRVLILGAGGTAKALSYILHANGIEIEILNRSDKRAEFINYNFNTYSNFKVSNYDLVINTTSAGLCGDELPCDEIVLREILSNSKFAFDVIYNRQTPFLRIANDMGLKIKDGKDMLLYQAVLAFNLFYDNKFDESKITELMRRAFEL
ncbi:MAG: shikimate dehydrogenase [Campylobacter lanienae]|uniref:shikimate dehydrogenase n=1 Tax=Campylobacter lanienae TaxID=75658 RepID=UPI00242A43DC|nr:shikimate dehydrogenase [Campylobacter lanienae]MCI5539434.1 shikimate dehydrogenase [Campylobacter lanienae]